MAIEIPGYGGRNSDWGVVTLLPSTKAIKGDKCQYKAAEGVYWDLLYTAESAEYPWNKIGGPPLYAQYIGTGEQPLTTTSETKSSTNAPSVTLPAVKMEADVRWGAGGMNTSAAGVQARMWLAIAGATSSNYNRQILGYNIAAAGGAPGHGHYRGSFTASQVVAAYYSRVGSAGTVEFVGPWVEVDPIRAG